VALIDVQGGRALPVGVVVVWPGIELDTGLHAPISIAISSTRPGRAILDMPVYAATDPRSDPSLSAST
jgi:hypothetical protein